MVIGIQDEILKINSQHLLDRLLMDKTTKSNIIWATDAYTELGAAYHRDKEITVDLITGQHSGVIKNRARKALEQQSERTRKHAEVFTPLWICEKMNDHIDEMWFGRKQGIHKTDPETGHIVFTSSKKWRYYVDSRRLEITCGEAPYLVSRYDVSTGDAIPLEKRIGILDRKLRAVTENAATEEEWVTWAIRAYQATYGYEFQGDNVLIARVNLLMTFEEYLYDRWKRKPTEKEYQTITNIICWNIWQMDGLSGTIPYCKAEEEEQQISIFGWLGIETDSELKNKQPKCRINDWRRENSSEYLTVNEGERKMKFDFIIGNPPYQEPQENTSDKPVYNFFMDAAYALADKVELITPARFLFNAGKTPKAWNAKISGDGQVVVIEFDKYTVELVPGFKNADDSFKYPDTHDGGSWKTTNPIPEQNECKNCDDASNGIFFDFCHILRSWKNAVGVSMGGLLIDTLVYDHFPEKENYSKSGYGDYLSILTNVFEYLKNQKKDREFWYAVGSKQKVYNSDNGAFVSKAKAAYDRLNGTTNDTEGINDILIDLLGVDFPAAEESKSMVEFSRDRYKHIRGAEREQFIEELFPVDIHYSLRIDCTVSQDGFRSHLLSEILREHKWLSRKKKLDFHIVRTNCPQPYSIYWKVRNVGAEAAKRNMIRGEIKLTDNTHQKENTDFYGPHYVECFLVKRGICVARARIDVPIE